MIAILSDIHGNYAALTAVLKQISQMKITELICLGDVCGYYSQINEVCNKLRDLNVFTLLGNHDWYIAQNESCPRSHSANICLNFQRKIISSNNKLWLQSLSPVGIYKDLQITHGGWINNLDEYLKPSAEYFSQLNGFKFVSGHTHVPLIWRGNEKIYCNPGSVGQPRDGNPEASFATYSSGMFYLHRVPYDISWVQKDMKNNGFTDYFYKNLSAGTRIGGETD